MLYVLDEENKVIPVETSEEWMIWMRENQHRRRVAEDFVADVRISTLFFGTDLGFMPGGPPITFETMIFGGQLDLASYRYSTWKEAEEGHKKATEQATAVLAN